jgi:hypothetical protein
MSVVLQGLVKEGINRAGRCGTVEEGDCSLEDVVECGKDARFKREGDGRGGGWEGERGFEEGGGEFLEGVVEEVPLGKECGCPELTSIEARLENCGVEEGVDVVKMTKIG